MKLHTVRSHVRRSPRRRVNFDTHTDLMIDALWLVVLDAIEQALRGEMEAR
jgi:hypothetical protein